jgi:RNA polymerase sigma-70 factor (ECF subfamily)
MGISSSQQTVASGQAADRVAEREAAFVRLYRRYYDNVFRYCMHRLFDRHAAEDLTAEVFLKIVEHFERFGGRDERQLRHWIYRIATNAVNGHLRKTRRRRSLLRRFAGSGPDSTADPPEPLDGTVAQLKAAMHGLRTRYQTILTLRFFENLKPNEIAETLGCSPATVRSQLARAITQLRRKLTAAGVLDPGDDRDE